MPIEEIGGCIVFNQKWKLSKYKWMNEYQFYIGPFWFYIRFEE